MCYREVNIEGLIEYLKLKNELTEIEKSILDSYKLICDKNSSKEELIYQIQENRKNYILVQEEVKNITLIPNSNISVKKLFELNIDELKTNLLNQELIMCKKYIKEKYN